MKRALPASRPFPSSPPEPAVPPGTQLLAVLAALWLLPAALSFAALDNSHHDFSRFMPDNDACLACHGRMDANSYPALEDELGGVGGHCIFLCHSGQGVLADTGGLVPAPGPSVDVADYGTTGLPDYTAVYFTLSHGRAPENLKNGAGTPVPWPPPGMIGTGAALGARMECTSCHNVHDNRYPPFLIAPLAATAPALNGLCDRCHPERATNNLLGPPDGSHPVDFQISGMAAATRGEPGRHPRRILVQKYGRRDGSGAVNVFDVPNPSPAELRDPDLHWNMGGHLASGPDDPMSPWAGEVGPQQMGCFTCHSAHRTKVNGEDKLVVVRAFEPKDGWSPLCVGCHGAARSLDGDRNDWDVGTTGFGHPAGAATTRDAGALYTTTVGDFRFRIAAVMHVGPQGGNRLGDGGQIGCTTCHKVHFGMPGTMAIANLGQNSRSVCKSCHSGVGIPNENDMTKGGLDTSGHNAANSHHVSAPIVTVGGAHTQFNELGGHPLVIKGPSWGNPTTGIGDIAAGMDCADCHVFNGTAHNW